MTGPGLSRETVEEELVIDCDESGGNPFKKKSPGTKEIGDIECEILWNPVTPTGAHQVVRATVVGTVTASGNALVTITSAGMPGSPLALNVPVVLGTAAPGIRSAIVTYLQTNGAAAAVRALWDITDSGVASFDFTRKEPDANDATANVAIATGTATGITAAPASVIVTPGVAGEENDQNHHLFEDDFDNETATYWRIVHPNDQVTGVIVHATVKEVGEPSYEANSNVKRTITIEPTGEFYKAGNQIEDEVLPADIEAPEDHYGHH